MHADRYHIIVTHVQATDRISKKRTENYKKRKGTPMGRVMDKHMANQISSNVYYDVLLSTEDEFHEYTGEFFDRQKAITISAWPASVGKKLTPDQIYHMDAITLSRFDIKALEYLHGKYDGSNAPCTIMKDLGNGKSEEIVSDGLRDKIEKALYLLDRRTRATYGAGRVATEIRENDDALFPKAQFMGCIEHEASSAFICSGNDESKVAEFIKYKKPGDKRNRIMMRFSNALEVYNSAHVNGRATKTIYPLMSANTVYATLKVMPIIITFVIDKHPNMPYYKFNSFIRFRLNECEKYFMQMEHEFVMKNIEYFRRKNRVPRSHVHLFVKQYKKENVDAMIAEGRLTLLEDDIVTFDSLEKVFCDDFNASSIHDMDTMEELREVMMLSPEEFAEVEEDIGYFTYNGVKYYQPRHPSSLWGSDYLKFREALVVKLTPIYRKKYEEDEGFRKDVSSTMPDIIFESLMGYSIIHMYEMKEAHPGKGYAAHFNIQMMPVKKILKVLNRMAKQQSGEINPFSEVRIPDASMGITLSFGIGLRDTFRRCILKF